MNEYRNNLKEEFQDEDYRYAYAEDFLNTSIATQIRVLREQRNNMTQQDLAEKIGTKQAGISRLENVNYSAWKTETLRKLARALGMRLRITFETFGTLLDEAEHFSRTSLQRPDFEHDPAFAQEAEQNTRLIAVGLPYSDEWTADAILSDHGSNVVSTSERVQTLLWEKAG
ncbi:MAG: helix-turn-helix transcriptional regulator [Acidobacteria bacterium]|nr:helix-turn-helix transcriptional regulator [Acidobacteriota bacterium]